MLYVMSEGRNTEYPQMPMRIFGFCSQFARDVRIVAARKLEILICRNL